MQKIARFPGLKLPDPLNLNQIRGRNGQIFVVSDKSYEAWKAERKSIKPPQIQLDLQKANWLRDQLSISPNQSELARRIGTDRSSMIRTLNLTRLTPAIKEYITQLEPGTGCCPLTKKRLRYLVSIADPEVQLEKFRQLIGSLQSSNISYTKIPAFL